MTGLVNKEANKLSWVMYFFFYKDFIHLFMREREREREAETQAEGEVGSMQGARCGTQSRDSRITPWAKGSAKPLGHWGCHVFLVHSTVVGKHTNI